MSFCHLYQILIACSLFIVTISSNPANSQDYNEVDVTVEFDNLIEPGNITAQAITSDEGLEALGVRLNETSGKFELSAPGGQIFSILGAVFDITSSDTKFSGKITTTIPYNSTYVSLPSLFPDNANNDVRLLHYDGNNWNDVTTSVNPYNNSVSGEVDELGPVVAVVSNSQKSSSGLTLVTYKDPGGKFELQHP